MVENNVHVAKKLFALDEPANNEIGLRVRPLVVGGFAVYADAMLIAIHADQGTADADCLRLMLQQAQD
jgi:hypothetical protein